MGDYKRKWGDRKDGKWVKDITGLQAMMTVLFPHRTECEVYLNDIIDVTELLKYLEEKNKHSECKITVMHCIITILAKILRERPLLNRFVQGARVYEHNDISFSFAAKKQFADKAEEAIIKLVPKDEDTLCDVAKRIVDEVSQVREKEADINGLDKIMNSFAKWPRILLIIASKILLILDYWGKVPDSVCKGDPDFSSVLLSNLGSIKNPAVYHHLNNYGTTSVMFTIGTIHKAEIMMQDGHKEVRDVLDIGVTLDERIGDGFYFAKSLKLIHYCLEHLELLDKPIGEPSGFDY